MSLVNMGVIGAGHWGPNLIRNFHNKQRSVVSWVADRDGRRLERIRDRFPEVRLTPNAVDVLGDPNVDAVVVATPTVTHYELVKQALAAGKHVMGEKPLADSTAHCDEHIELAEAGGRVLLVGHEFLFNPAVLWVREELRQNKLGRVYYLSSARTNLGPIRTDLDAAWDLASQDFSVFNFWLDSAPLRLLRVPARRACVPLWAQL